MLRLFDTAVARLASAAVGSSDVANAARVRLEYRLRSVTRTVIDHNHLVAWANRRKNRVNRPTNQFGAIIGRYDNTS